MTKEISDLIEEMKPAARHIGGIVSSNLVLDYDDDPVEPVRYICNTDKELEDTKSVLEVFRIKYTLSGNEIITDIPYEVIEGIWGIMCFIADF